MADPFSIRLFVVDGDPQGIRLVDRMNWTGVGVVFPRERWQTARIRPELSRTGVYVLVGYEEDDEDIPTLYIGESDSVCDRIDTHDLNKEFWEDGFVFTTSNNGLNKAHVRWLESELIQQAKKASRSKLVNGTSPSAPRLSEAERADSGAFLREILQILPIMGLRAFEEPTPVAIPAAGPVPTVSLAQSSDDVVVVVPAQEEGFKAVFLGEHRWRSIRIAGGRLQQIRYAAAYQTRPVSAVTHYAPVASIEPYGESGKYQLVFSGPPVAIGPLPFADAPPGSMKSPRYTTLGKLLSARTLTDLL